jgi:hypothetical protein
MMEIRTKTQLEVEDLKTGTKLFSGPFFDIGLDNGQEKERLAGVLQRVSVEEELCIALKVEKVMLRDPHAPSGQQPALAVGIAGAESLQYIVGTFVCDVLQSCPTVNSQLKVLSVEGICGHSSTNGNFPCRDYTAFHAVLRAVSLGTSIVKVVLRNNKLTDEHMELIAVLASSHRRPVMEILDIGENSITVEGLKVLLRTPSVCCFGGCKNLYLNGNENLDIMEAVAAIKDASSSLSFRFFTSPRNFHFGTNGKPLSTEDMNRVKEAVKTGAKAFDVLIDGQSTLQQVLNEEDDDVDNDVSSLPTVYDTTEQVEDEDIYSDAKASGVLEKEEFEAAMVMEVDA